jgi:hypothetical protein
MTASTSSGEINPVDLANLLAKGISPLLIARLSSLKAESFASMTDILTHKKLGTPAQLGVVFEELQILFL